MKQQARRIGILSPSVRRRRRGAWLWGGGLILSAIACLWLTGSIGRQVQEGSELLTVNGQEASAAEFKMYLDFNKAVVADYYKQTYSADYGPQFWTTAYAGVTPMQKLLEAAKTQLTQTTARQLLAQQNGVVQNISYRAFLEGMAAENERRRTAAARKEVVYGPLTLDIQAYYSYYLSNLEQATVEALRTNGTITLTEEQLQRAYEGSRASQYTQQGTRMLEWATLPYGSGTAFQDQSAAQVQMDALKRAVDAGSGFAASASRLSIPVRDARLTKDSRRSAALDSPLALQQAEELEAGETSDIFEENGELHLIRCVSVDGAEVQSYAQVKDAIAGQLALEAYRALVEREVKAASVMWNADAGVNLVQAWLSQS